MHVDETGIRILSDMSAIFEQYVCIDDNQKLEVSRHFLISTWEQRLFYCSSLSDLDILNNVTVIYVLVSLRPVFIEMVTAVMAMTARRSGGILGWVLYTGL